MKKIISIVLVLIMLFSFTACEKLSVSNQIVSMTVSGQGTKKLTFTLKGEMANYDREVDYYGLEPSESKYFEIAEKSAKEKTVKYTVTGWQLGTSSFNIYLLKDGEIVTTIHGDITVSEGLKLTCQNLSTLEEIPTKELEIEDIEVPIRDGQSDLLYIKSVGDTGDWTVADYDDSVVKVEFLKKEDDNEIFFITGLTEGAIDVQFIQRAAGQQLVISYSITTSTNDDADVKPYLVSVDNVVRSEYTFEDEIKNLDQSDVTNFINVLDPEFSIPDKYKIESAVFYNYKTGDVYETEDYANFDINAVAGYFDAISVQVEGADVSFEYVKTAATTLKKECALIDSLKQTEWLEDLSYGDKTVKFYSMTSGFHIALWENNGKFYMITFTSETQTDDLCKQVLDEFLL